MSDLIDPAAGFPLPGRRLPTIEGDGVRLRAITEGDVEELYRLFSDPGVTRHMSIPTLGSRDDAKRMLREIDAHFRSHSLYQWGVVEPGGPLCGTVTLAGLDAAHRRAEIGFALAPAVRGRGLMTRAVAAVLDFGYARMRLHRIEADVSPDNAASVRLLENLGFRREGLLRERWLVGGEKQDSLMLGLLAGDRTEGIA